MWEITRETPFIKYRRGTRGCSLEVVREVCGALVSTWVSGVVPRCHFAFWLSVHQQHFNSSVEIRGSANLAAPLSGFRHSGTASKPYGKFWSAALVCNRFKGGLRLNLLSAAPPSAPVAPSSVHLRVIAVRSCQLKANAPPKLRLGAGGFRRRRPWSTHGTPPCLREDRDHSHPRRPEPRVHRSAPHLASRQAGSCR